MKKKLRQYQVDNIRDVFSEFKKGNKRVIYQLPTGGGKTLTSCELIHFFVEKNKPFEALFFVHRVELLEQFKRSFESQFNDFQVGIIDADTKMKRFDLSVNVAMVETGYKRFKKDSSFFGDKIRLVIMDEAHNSNFDKVLDFFPNAYIIGLTATPIRQGNSNPLNKHYNSIVCGPAIQELINQNSLLPNLTYVIDNKINYKNLKKVAGDYSSSSIFNELKNEKYVQNVIKVYIEKSLNKKTMVFNSNVAHSKLLTEAFIKAGFDAKHLDGSMKEEDRKSVLKWFEITPNAILNNVAVLTAGYDEPTIETVIFNLPTTSLSKWLQCCGRGSRLSFGKEFFTIIDLGGNAERLGDWSFDHDWKGIFETAKYKLAGEGEAPIKICPECACAVHISVMECPACGFKFIKQEEAREEEEEIKVKLLVNNFAKKVNVHKISNFVEKSGWKDYAGLYLIRDILRKDLKGSNILEGSLEYEKLKSIYFEEVEKWCEINGKKFDSWHKSFAERIINEKQEV